MIVELGPGDVERVRALRLSLGEHHAALETPPGWRVRDPYEAWAAWRDGTRERLAGSDAALLASVAGPDADPDGFALVHLLPAGPRPILEPTGPHGELAVLVVGPDARGDGTGRALHDAAADWLRDRGARSMQIGVRAANEGALRFYARRGAVPAFTTLVQDLGPG